MLKNRPLPSSIKVTLLSSAVPDSSRSRPGRAIMMAMRRSAPTTSPANRIRAPAPFGRGMPEHSSASADQSKVPVNAPNSSVFRRPCGPQSFADGAVSRAGNTTAGLPAAAPPGGSDSMAWWQPASMPGTNTAAHRHTASRLAELIIPDVFINFLQCTARSTVGKGCIITELRLV